MRMDSGGEYGAHTAQALVACLWLVFSTIPLISTCPAMGQVDSSAAAGEEATEVRGYKTDASRLAEVAARLRTKYKAHPAVRVAVDPRTQQIIVIAPPAVHAQISSDLAEWDGAAHDEDSGPSDLRAAPLVSSTAAYQLEHISWRELEDVIGRILRSRLSVATSRNGELATLSTQVDGRLEPVLQIDRRRDVVSFIGPQESVANWQRVVQAVDDERAAGDLETQFIPIRGADPGRVQATVSQLGKVALKSGESEVEMPRPRWGGRLVSLIFQDQDGQALGGATQEPPGQPQGDPQAPPGQGGGGLIGNVQIEFLEGLDVIILRGNKRDVERVQRIIEDIERLSAETQPIIEILELEHVNSDAVSTLVSELYEEILSPRQGQVAIRALIDPNAVLLIGRQESVAVVVDLIKKLDQPMQEAGRFEIFRLEHISALDAEQTIRNFFVNRPGLDTELRTGLGARVQVLADYRSNSLIVQASPRDLQEVARLIESIDVEEAESAAEIRVFRLKNALADDLATTLQTAISGQPSAPTPGQVPGQAAGASAQINLPSSSIEFKLIDDNGERLLQSAILSGVQITAEPSINALVVRAPERSMDLIAALIGQLDRLPDAEAQIKVFTIVNGDATNLAAMLQQLFGQTVTAGQGTAQLGGLGFGLQQPQLQTSGGETSLVPLRFAVDVRTNSIIASGSESDLGVVEAILLRLDEGDIETRRLEVVRLQNAPAQDVANAITTLLTSQRTLIQQQLLFNQAISPFEQIEREVIVVPEIVTNSLIVSATPRYFDEVMQVIQDLDFRPPMVMVQVIIAEVTLNETFEFGVELGLQDDLLFDRGIAVDDLGNAVAPSSPGFNFNTVTSMSPLPNVNSIGRELLAGQGLTNLGVGRLDGGLILSAANESINILIRALETQGHVQVLSRPQVMTLNNQLAFVQVGADVSRITGTTITEGIVQNNIEDVQTGLILRIQPLINEDGIIVMNIDAERSALGDEDDGTLVAIDQNDNPIRAAPINRTTAQTTISAKSGQTVVFAGLISTTKTVSTRRVPYIADIPLLGKLFEFETNSDARSELLIIMTPHIVENDEDYELIKAIESERMNWCLADIVQLHGNVGLQGGSSLFCCDEVPVIYPDLQPHGVELSPLIVPDPQLPGVVEPLPVDAMPLSDSSVSRAPLGAPQFTGQTEFAQPQVGPPSSTAAGYRTTVTYGPSSQPSLVQPATLTRLPDVSQETP